MRNKKTHIAVIDTGVNAKRKEFEDIEIIQHNLCGEQILTYCGKNDDVGHGTAVCFIISTTSYKCAIHSVKIMGHNMKCSSRRLIDALKFIDADLDCDIIHLSLGVYQDENTKELEDICNKITSKGTIIICAFDNDGLISYPAAFPCVIGVDWHEYCVHPNQYYYIENSPVNILGIGSNQRVPWLEDSYKVVAGSSFAAPHITKLVSSAITDGFCRADVLQYLKRNAAALYTEPQTCYKPLDQLKIKKAILFPYSKEICSLVRYHDMLNFEIAGVYDLPIFGRVGKSISSITDINEMDGLHISDYSKIDWSSDFDTIVVGHLDLINKITYTDFGENILNHALRENKNIYFFDGNEMHKNRGIDINFPQIELSQIPRNTQGKLHKIPCPVLGVCGTAPNQGKFSIQMVLRRAFLKLGYIVGQLGTEPQSMLFGFDYVVPIGYGAKNELTISDSVLMYNSFLNQIYRNKHPDIIIAGSQSHTVPNNWGNLGFYPMNQFAFLLGVEPDVIILCIEVDDEYEYIERTICFLESYFESKVIALAFLPVQKTRNWVIKRLFSTTLDESEITKKKEELRKRTGKQSFVIGNQKDEADLIKVLTETLS